MIAIKALPLLAILARMSVHSVAANTCVNDADFEIASPLKRDNGAMLSCKKIRNKENRRSLLCTNPLVSEKCPQSCGLCCDDDEDYKFTLKNKVLDVKCDWLAKNPSKKHDRVNRYCNTPLYFSNGSTVRDACPKACEFCFTEILPVPTSSPTSSSPTISPSQSPSSQPTRPPSPQPSPFPTLHPTVVPSDTPTNIPSVEPSAQPSSLPSSLPSDEPSTMPSAEPSAMPSSIPSDEPSVMPSDEPSTMPSSLPSDQPSVYPSSDPSMAPSSVPSDQPSQFPSIYPSDEPTKTPTQSIKPSASPSKSPVGPTPAPTPVPTSAPTAAPTASPTTAAPTACTDSSVYQFSLEYSGYIRNCDFLTLHEDDSKDVARIQKYCANAAIATNCCASCATYVPPS